MDRPDLDEFLTALNGFIEKKPDLDNKSKLPQDPSYLRFLDIFCRSVGSVEGQLILNMEGKGLQTVISSGTSKEFDAIINNAAGATGRDPSPVDAAYRDQLVVAVVELKRGIGIPQWFMEATTKEKFKSLVAVPLIGQNRPVGVLCAYYRDVCLFDKGTLERLMTIGKMVGAALEKSGERSVSAAETTDFTFPVIDTYLGLLTKQTVTPTHVFQALTKVLAKALVPSGLVTGPVRVSNSELVITVSDGAGVPPDAVGHRFPVPPMLAQAVLLGQGNRLKTNVSVADWGPFRQLVGGKTVAAICHPVIWQKQPIAAVIAWRGDKNPFTESDESLLSRLAGITALALRAA